MHMYTYTHIHRNIHTYTHVYIYTPIHIYICTYIHMYIYTYVHMYIYTYTYLHTYIPTYIHTYIYTYIHTYVHIHKYIQIYIYTYIHIDIYTYIHMYMYTYIHIHIYTYIHIYICTYIHIYIYTYIHIHKYAYTYIFTHMQNIRFAHTCIHKTTAFASIGKQNTQSSRGGISTWPLSLVLLPRSEWTCLRCACNPTLEYLAMNLGVSVTPRPLPSRRPQLLTKHLHEAARKGHCLSAAFLCLLRCLCCKNAITLKTCRKLWTRGYLAYSPVSGIQELNSSPNLAGSSPGVSIQSHPGL